MVNSRRIIGIDFIRTDPEGGMYGIYESYNSGENWHMVTQSRTIESLINFAKLKYNKNTPMIMTEQIQQLLDYEFMCEKERFQISKQEKAVKQIVNKTGWMQRLATFLKKEYCNGKKMWRRNKSGH